MNYLHFLIAARLARFDLSAADNQLENTGRDTPRRVLLVKQLLLSLANVNDLELILRPLYQQEPQLSASYKPHAKGIEFAKYLRNIFVGHIDPKLTAKAAEWKPEIFALLGNKLKVSASEEVMLMAVGSMLSNAVLETAINTFVSGSDSHKLFDTETDLGYPPDSIRFPNWLGSTVHGAIAFLEEVESAVSNYYELPDYDENMFELAFKAGMTNFKFISRKG